MSVQSIYPDDWRHVPGRNAPGSWIRGRPPNTCSHGARRRDRVWNLMRHTTFRFALAPTAEQARILARHCGASRFAFNQSLRLVTDALAASKTDPLATVPWSGFDLINAFNHWKKSERAGRVFVVSPDGTTTKQVTGLSWRTEVSAQVFEEAAVDLGRALARYAEAKGQFGFPRQRRKGRHRESFRLRNKSDPSGRDGIRVGEPHPRSVTLPNIGTIRVHDDTRRLRRMLRPSSNSTRASVRPSGRRVPWSCPRRSRGALTDGMCA
jgi:hypothetical protein